MEKQADRSSASLRTFFLYGLVGGIVSTIILFIGTRLLAFPFPPEAIFQLLIAPVPGSIQSIVVETFREYAKYATFVLSAAFYTLIFGLIGVVTRLLFGTKLRDKWIQAIAIATAFPSGIALGLDSLLISRSSALTSTVGWLVSAVLILGANLAFAIVLVQLAISQHVLAALQKGQIRLGEISPSRRGFLKKVVIAAVALGLAGLAARVGLDIFSGQPVIRSNTPIPIDNPPHLEDLGDLPAIFRDQRISDLLGSEVTDNRVFYRVDINPIPPQLDLDKWSLKVSGKVNNPFTLDGDSLLALPRKDEYATLECVSNTINPPGALISNAKWTGIPLGTLLDRAGIPSEAKNVVFHCADGYAVGVPLDRATKPEALLAYKMNDDLLPNEHGFPLRAIVPGIYGMMNAKWITEIEVTDQTYLGYWQERGWSNDARIRTTSIIYYPPPEAQINGTIPVAGVAFAGDRGISKVEVSVDGGNTWNQAILKKPRSQNSWVLWAYEWTPTIKGSVTITVRAYDGTGTVQDANARQPFPSGASGYHSQQVTVS